MPTRSGQNLWLWILVVLCGLSAAAQPPGEINSWFPIRQGDSWTYNWSYRLGPAGTAPVQTLKRTRAFEGREFTDTGLADKLAAENGDYALFTVTPQGLLLHGAAEMQRNARFIFDPPITLLTSQMKAGEWLRTEQLAEDGVTVRRFASRFETVPAVDTPMGRFENCLKLLWTLDDPVQHHETTYFLARGIGIVAYTLDVKIDQPRQFEMHVEAHLTLAQLEGRTFRQAGEIPLFLASRRGLVENGRARSMLRRAHESQYLWDRKFPGASGTFSYQLVGPGRPERLEAVRGRITIGQDFGVQVDCPDATTRAAVYAEISQLVSYRQPRPFTELFNPTQSRIGFGESSGPTTEILVSDESGTNARYLLADREIVRISRSYGRVRFVNQLRSFKTDDGRFVANEADIQYYSNESGAAVGQTVYRDRYVKVGSWWLPAVREKSESGKEPRQSIRLTIDWN